MVKGRQSGIIPLPKVGRKRGRLMSRRRLIPILALVLLIAAGGLALYQFVINPWLTSRLPSQRRNRC